MEFEEEIVIGGISGRFPECNNVEEFKEALLRGDDLMTVDDRRFPVGIKDVPKRSGKIPEIDKFDASFFGINPNQANFTDPRQRILLETVYEAIIDAGYNPNELRGSKTGVFVGLSLFTNFDEITTEDSHGYSILGASLCSAANRISHCFDFTGPSYSLDTGDSSSLYAFTNAVDQLKKGEIKYAIVGGTHVGLNPKESQQYNNLNILSPDGTCKVFSKERNGFVRSEAICSYFLQKKSSSRRCYATVLGSKTNTNGYCKDGYMVPSAEGQLKLMQELYAEAKVSVNDLAYLELHGVGSQVGDKCECQAIVNMFGEKRKLPLLIGSVKSNVGHCEAAAGLAGITKVLLAMEYGIIPANINYAPIDDSIPGLADGKLQVVTKHTQWKSNGVAGINGFGFGGTNAHVILKPHVKNRVTPLVKHKHRLVHVSGRTEEAVNYFLNQIEKNQRDEEFLSLLDEIHKSNVDGHSFRGYAVLGKHSITEVTKCKSEKRPIWFVYPGLGAQWPGAGKDLMHIEVFRNTINRCAEAMKPYGVDLIDIIMNASPSAMNKLANCAALITSVSLALTDLLASMGIKPDFFVGHSVGEVGCAYANGDLTPEQAILLSFAICYACITAKVPPGQMAAVGLSKEEIKKILPEDVVIACENSKDNVTIAGPIDSTKKFVAELQQNGVFAKLIFSDGIALHSKYVVHSKKYFEDFASKLIPDPKLRSKKWISSFVPSDRMHEKWANFNCTEYHANNYISTVLFDRIFEHIPPNAIVVEVGSHGLLQAIFRRELGAENTLLTVLNKNAKEQEQFFWSSIGKIYNAGGQPNLRSFYKETVFPVSPGTKMIAPLVKWDHSTSWFVPYWKNQNSCDQRVSVNLSDAKYSYLKGHIIDGQVVMPAAAYLELVWTLKANMFLKDILELPIVLENINFKRTTILAEDENIEFIVSIIAESGNFEIFEGETLVVSGNIRIPEDVSKEFKTANIENNENDLPVMNREDFYKETYLRNYFYGSVFKGISECDIIGLKGKIEWMDNYTSFIDSMCQLSFLSESTNNLLVPAAIKKIVIDPISHSEGIHNKYIEVKRDPYCRITKSKGIEIYGLKFKQIPQRSAPDPSPLLETFEFVYYDSPDNKRFNLNTSLLIAVQIILQNIPGPIKKLTIGELKETEDSNLQLTAQIQQILKNQVLTESDYLITSPNLVKELNTKFEAMVADYNVYKQYGLNIFQENLRKNGFLIYIGQIDDAGFTDLDIIFRSTHLCLLREKLNFPTLYDTIRIRNTEFTWLEKLKQCVKSREKNIVFLYSQHEDITGIIGLQKCLMAEQTEVEFKSIICPDEEADIFSIHDEFYKNQFSKRLAVNVLRKCNWGTFVHLPLEQITPKYTENAELHLTNSDDLKLHWVKQLPLSLVTLIRMMRSTRYQKFKKINRKPFDIICTVFATQEETAQNLKIIVGVAVPPTYGQIRFISHCIYEPQQNLELVNVYYSALNFNCVTNALAHVFSYSGVTTDGRRVMGIVPTDRISTQVMNDAELTWNVPDSWTLIEAATVPFDYLKSYYALIIQGQMERYDSILINGATTGTGIASISIALSLEATIFTTVNSEEEKVLLKKLYPLLDESNIGNLWDLSYEHLIQRKTKGKGVDLILNCVGGLSGSLLGCLSKRGRYLLIEDIDMSNETILDSSILPDNCSFHRILLDSILEENSNTKLKLKNLITQGIASEVIKPLPSAVFEPQEIVAAVKLTRSEKFKKIVIKLRDKKFCNVPKILAHPKLVLKSNKVYIVIGGLGAIGLELASWLIQKGATKVVLNARRNIFNGYQAFCMRKWSELTDITVKVDLNDATTLSGAESLISETQKLGPIGGVFNAATVLHDANIIDQTTNKFEEVFKPKILVGVNMDIVTRKLCSELDYFVAFSTVVAGRGNIGQTNYGMANSALERLCEKRRRDNLPGLAVQWGPVDVGRSTEQKNLFKMVPQRISSCLETLERFLLQNVTVGSSLVVVAREKKSVESTPTEKTVIEKIADVLGVNLDSVDKDSPFFRLGLDSVMSAEIKHILYQNYQVDIATAQISKFTFRYFLNLERDKLKPTSIVYGEHFPPPFVSKTPIVKMKENEESTKILFMLHPLEGNLYYLNPLASRLNANVYGLQATKDTNFTSIEDAGTYFLKYIRKVQTKGPYYLCGFSYGATLGFEIGLQLEREGEEVRLLALDGSPDYVRLEFKDLNNVDFRTARVIPPMFKGVNFDKAKAILEKYPETSNTSNERMSALLELISEDTGIDSEELFHAGYQMLNRCRAAYRYRPIQKFKGKIKLVRKMINIQEKAENYNLQKYCHNKIEVEKLNGDHVTILFGDNLETLSKIANEWIDSV